MFGNKLRILRGDLDVKSVSSSIGVSESSWKKYEREERIPRDEVKLKIADFFKTSVQEIFFSKEWALFVLIGCNLWKNKDTVKI